MKWISLTGGLVSALTIFAMVSAYPDFWIFSQAEARLRALETLEIRTATSVAQVTADYEEHIEAQLSASKLIAQELANTRLLVEEKYIDLSVQMEVNSLETEIKELTRQIATERNEYDRLLRIINGGAASGPSEETFRARDRVLEQIASYELQLDAAVRELNRLML